MTTPPHLAELSLTQASSGSPEQFMAAVARAFVIDFDPDTWPSRDVFEPDRAFGYTVDGSWVSTCAAYTRQLTVPGGVSVPAAAVTFVSVASSYRRRGLLTQMMGHQLAELADRGDPVALLWASEGGIYGRYGYGAAVPSLSISGRTGETAFRPDVDLGGGSVGEVGVEEWRRVVEPLHARLLPERTGSLTRPSLWWDQFTSDHPTRRGSASPYRFALHYGATGEPDGYLAFRTSGSAGLSPDIEVRVGAVDATDPRGLARLWRFALDLDLVRTFRGSVPVDDPLRHLVQNPDAVQASLGENTFLRLVDLPRALELRHYPVEVDLVLGVRDAQLSQNDGTFRLQTGPDGAQVQRTSAPADVELDVRDLAAIYLGGTSAALLQRGGLLRERRPGAAAQLGSAFSWWRQPCCWDYF